MGLLDSFNEFVKTPEGQGLLSAAFGGMATANRGQPINSLGKAGLAGIMGYGNALDRQDKQAEQAFQNQYRTMQMAKLQRESAALAGYRDTLPEADRAVFDVDPAGFIAAARKTAEGYTLTPGSKRFQGSQVVAEVPMERKAPEGMQYDQAGNLVEIPGYVQMKSKISAAGRNPQQPMQPVAYVDGSGNTVWGTITEAKGRPAANYSPTVQGAVTGAREEAKAGVEKGAAAQKAIKQSNQFLAAAKQAEALLDSNPTQSGAGAAVDAAGRMIGVATKGGTVATELEALSGWMVSNVPRMEGPQSNFDVDNYKTMAGKVGDRTVPISERKAALKRVIELQEKYKSLNQPAGQGQRQVVRRGRYGGKSVVEYSDGSIEYAD